MMKKNQKKNKQLNQLHKESDRLELDQIRRLLALPMNKRTHFLRVKLPSGGSSL